MPFPVSFRQFFTLSRRSRGNDPEQTTLVSMESVRPCTPVTSRVPRQQPTLALSIELKVRTDPAAKLCSDIDPSGRASLAALILFWRFLDRPASPPLLAEAADSGPIAAATHSRKKCTPIRESPALPDSTSASMNCCMHSTAQLLFSMARNSTSSPASFSSLFVVPIRGALFSGSRGGYTAMIQGWAMSTSFALGRPGPT
mmetsp:Transcript_11646/g.25201  ORF Transcript_11646/g.25201 Transcript_11646/m.25201 type:complete len:200 (+) Transcript_11646:711-1310(+)